MARRWSSSLDSERVLHLLDWRRHDRVATQSRVCLLFFWDQEFVPQGQIIDYKFYCNVLRHLREDVRQKWLDLWSMKNLILHDNNAPCQWAFLTCQFLAQSILSLPHPPYVSDLAPVNFCLFSKLKMQFKDHRFNTIVEIQCKLQKVLD